MLNFKILFFFFLSVSCSKNEDQKFPKQYLIFPPTEENINRCGERRGFFDRFGLSISNFYIVDKSLKTENDSIAILKPFYTQTDLSYCSPKHFSHNLLLVYDIRKKQSKMYKNLLFSDDRNIYQELSKNDNGFIILGEQGSSSKLFTKIFISNHKIDSIQIESWGNYQYFKTYKFQNFFLDKFNVELIDSLQEANEASY